MSWRVKTGLIILTWLAAFFRLLGLFANWFHADEALFASFARHIAVWLDPLLVTQPVDKPPLLFYLQALFYPLFGPVEWAARMPNLIASLLLVPLVGVLVWRLYGDGLTAVLSATFIALSPFAIQFSPTAFTDPLMTTLLAASLAAVAGRSERRGWWCGLWFGLAMGTKYQAWLFWPLLAGIAWLVGWGWRDWRRWLVGLLPVLLGLLWWDVARTGGFSLWSRQIGNYGGVRPSWSWELWPRFWAWGEMWNWLAGGWLLLLLVAVCTAVLGWRAWRRPRQGSDFDLLFILYLLGYGLLHWLLAVPVWDRYYCH